MVALVGAAVVDGDLVGFAGLLFGRPDAMARQHATAPNWLIVFIRAIVLSEIARDARSNVL